MTHEVKHSEKRLLSKHRPITSHRNCTKMYIVFLCLLENILTFPKLLYFLHWQCVVRTGRRQQPAAFTRMSSLGKPVSVKTAIRFVVLAPGGREAVFSDVLQGALWWMFICLYRWHKLLSVSLSLGPTQSPAAFCHWIITIKTWLCGTA